MTQRRKEYLFLCLAFVVVGGIAPMVRAQGVAAPAIPGAAAGAAAPAAGAAGAAGQAGAAAGQAGTIWSSLGLDKKSIKECLEKLCKVPLVQLMSSSLKPVSTFSGGIIPELCPPNKAMMEDLAKPSTSAEGAAARIKMDEAEAKERRAAVRYLGTVDCRHWPEAEAALVAALRTDKNECVRFEAAAAMGHGCCCTKKIIDALKLTVDASDKDGNPAENSPRVRAMALKALNRCQACADPKVLEPERPERPTSPVRPEAPSREPPPAANTTTAAKEATGIQLTMHPTTEAADANPPTVVTGSLRSSNRPTDTPAAPRPAAKTLPTGRRSVYQIVFHAFRRDETR